MGNDRLLGGPGDDDIDGGAGDDRIDGGSGTDVMTGGPCKDLFYTGRGFDESEILDFGGGDSTVPGSLKIDRGKF